VTVQCHLRITATAVTCRTALRGVGISIAGAVKIAGIERRDELIVILFRRQAVLDTVIFGEECIFGKVGDAGVDRQIGGDIPVMLIAPLAAQRVQMQQVLDQMFQKGLLLRLAKRGKGGGIDRQERYAVAHRDAGFLAVQRPLFPAQVEDEMPVEGALAEQAHDGIFKGCTVHASQEMVWIASNTTLLYLSWAMASAISGILSSDLTKPKRRSRGRTAI